MIFLFSHSNNSVIKTLQLSFHTHEVIQDFYFDSLLNDSNPAHANVGIQHM